MAQGLANIIKPLSWLLAATVLVAAADGDPAPPVERYLQATLAQIEDVETARFEASGQPLSLAEFNTSYSSAMAAAVNEQQEKDLFAHHHKALECMSDRPPDGSEGMSPYQWRGRCKSELSDLALAVQNDSSRAAVQQEAASRAQQEAANRTQQLAPRPRPQPAQVPDQGGVPTVTMPQDGQAPDTPRQ